MSEKRGHKFEAEWGNGIREDFKAEMRREKHCN